jgi:N utilization substance protein A
VELSGENIKAFVRLLSKEKGLPAEVIKEALEEAIVQASKKNLSAFKDARCNLDLETGELQLFVVKTVADPVTNPRVEVSLAKARQVKENAEVGEDIEMPATPDQFGRIAAQSARQFVLQRLRDAERLKVYAEFRDRVGEIAPAEVARVERRELIMRLPGGEASLPFNEVIHPNRLRPSDRLKVLIVKVDPEARGHMVTVSRNHPQLVAKLFEQEVPEIADGIVEILGVAREPGVRSKIAVHSKNPDVDPVGACVGMKGSRVQMVVRELEGERIDIVPWDSDPTRFIQSALSPAKILTVLCNEKTRGAEVLVAKGNLSLAIGKRGQNARLAAKLTGWKIDVRSEEEDGELAGALARAEIERRYLDDFLSQMGELNDEQMGVFGRSEFNSVEKIADGDVDKLARQLGGLELAHIVKASALEYMEALRQMRAEVDAEQAAAAAEDGSQAADDSDAEPSEEEEQPSSYGDAVGEAEEAEGGEE